MKELLKVIRKVFEVEHSWSAWTRKMIGVVLVASLSINLYERYREVNPVNVRELPVAVLVANNPELGSEIRRMLMELMNRHSELKGIWVYSWADARSLVPVVDVGNQPDPLPLGYFGPSDGPQIGALVLGYCYPSNISHHNESCPINGNEDSWGVIVFLLETDELPRYLADDIRTISHQISHLLYHRTNSDIYSQTND